MSPSHIVAHGLLHRHPFLAAFPDGHPWWDSAGDAFASGDRRAWLDAVVAARAAVRCPGEGAG